MTTYYIVTTRNLVPILSDFIREKSTRGLAVKLIIREDLTTSNSLIPICSVIRDKIKSSYYEDRLSGLKPTFLLLIGDNNNIPGFTMSRNGQPYSSDSAYSMFTSNQTSPKLATGRIASSNPIEVKKITDMLMDKRNDSTCNINKRIIATGWIPRGVDCTDMKPWDDCAWQVQEEITISGYTPILHYSNDKTIIGTFDYRGEGDNVREYWRVNNSSKRNLIDEINKGASVLYYLGHGSDTTWANIGIKYTDTKYEVFSSNDLNSITGFIPYVFAFACNTGAIDNSSAMGVSWQHNLKSTGYLGADILSSTYINDRLPPFIFKQMFSGNEKCIGIIIKKAFQDFYRTLPPNVKSIAKTDFLNYRYFGDPESLVLVTKRSNLAARNWVNTIKRRNGILL